jgi:hypothetical protein
MTWKYIKSSPRTWYCNEGLTMHVEILDDSYWLSYLSPMDGYKILWKSFPTLAKAKKAATEMLTEVRTEYASINFIGLPSWWKPEAQETK